jgi:hypothetical protein
MTWEALSALSSATGTILVVVAAWIGLRQWRESLEARQFQAATVFIDQFQSTKIRNTRNFLRENATVIESLLATADGLSALDEFLAENAPGRGAPDSLLALRESLANIEFLAILSLTEQIPEYLERAYLAPTITGYWRAVNPVVQAIRTEGSPGKNIYLQNAEALARLAETGQIYGKNCSRLKAAERAKILESSHRSIKGS